MTIARGVGRENIYKCFLSLLSLLFHSVQELHLPNSIKFNLWLTDKPKSSKRRNVKGLLITTFSRCYVLILKQGFSRSSHQRCTMKKRCSSESLAQVLSCEFCEISKNNFFTEHLWTTASVLTPAITFGRRIFDSTQQIYRRRLSWAMALIASVGIKLLYHFRDL